MVACCRGFVCHDVVVLVACVPACFNRPFYKFWQFCNICCTSVKSAIIYEPLNSPESLHVALRPKKILLFPETWTKNRVGRSGFFYNGAYKYTKLLHTFLSLLSSSYIVL